MVNRCLFVNAIELPSVGRVARETKTNIIFCKITLSVFVET